jgi:transcriptional regulator with XRE-family HTH domain
LNIIKSLLVQNRKYEKITQKELVEKISNYNHNFKNLNTVTISRWETGVTTPSLLKKKLLMKFFYDSKCLIEDTDCYNIVNNAYKELYKPLSNIFTRNYQYLIGNFPEHKLGENTIQNLKKFHKKSEHVEHIIDIEIATNSTNYYNITSKVLTKWCTHPSTFCIIAERKKQHLGHFIMFKLKNHVAKEIAQHKRSEFDLKENDFCDIKENGTYYIHALYGRSPKIAAQLNVEAYMYLFKNLKYVDNIMIFSSRGDGVLLTKDYGIKIIDSGKNDIYGFKWYGMLSPVEDILFSDTVVKLIF